MYKSLTIYLYQNNFYEDLVLELYEIENKKKEIFRKVSTIKEFKYLDKSEKNDLLELINREIMILHDLMKANTTTAEELGFIPDYISNDDNDLD
ncbi:MAG: hypothetical protein A2057_17240 [Ignavibacteria bacterium GWA2_35_9]|nr:MAG: hypothetical protein A2057_17240 [Ignavibacteria bacterium GWA2_35_9]OGU43260.1 MAG: hypothetical protein A2000_08720 [Ignavibacteria bacterium GWB2_36_8]OGU53315.1 MAG: hypothetical protein A2080_14545 [Ignavibacteria bacterium GWC2_36_12]OGV08365.1 MAG: hypothetical protein A2330_09845 [Ignavibacteria bacterium RIFOXYB2_FULL_36_7]